MAKPIKTKYVSVHNREAERIGQSGIERVYYITFKIDGKMAKKSLIVDTATTMNFFGVSQPTPSR